MGTVHVINVVHTEPSWWDDQLTGLAKGVPLLFQRLEEIQNRTGVRVPITWCLYFGNGERGAVTGRLRPDTIDVRKDFFHERYEKGDEIGIHTHASDPREQYRYFRENAEKIESGGFPYPKTHAPGEFYLDSQTIRALEEAKIEVDAGLLVGARDYPGLVVHDGKITHSHPLLDGMILQDASCRDPSDYRSFRPYYPSYEDICRDGNSSVVEIPVFSYFKEIEDRPGGVVQTFRKQWAHRDEVAVDIVQFFWHPWELLNQPSEGEINHALIDGYHKVYSEIAKWEDVAFSTARKAAEAWKESVPQD